MLIMDYACAERRKGKCDRRAKGRFMKYKRGGAQRGANIQISGKSSSG
jgi:hypothetical protein